MYYDSIDVKTPVEVLTGDCKKEFKEAKIIEIIVRTKEDEDNETYVETSMIVEFIDGSTQKIANINGANGEMWRYKR